MVLPLVCLSVGPQLGEHNTERSEREGECGGGKEEGEERGRVWGRRGGKEEVL